MIMIHIVQVYPYEYNQFQYVHCSFNRIQHSDTSITRIYTVIINILQTKLFTDVNSNKQHTQEIILSYLFIFFKSLVYVLWNIL